MNSKLRVSLFLLVGLASYIQPYSVCSDGKTHCEGCQCCPDLCLCPGATNCRANLCPTPNSQCGGGGGHHATPATPAPTAAPATPSASPTAAPSDDLLFFDDFNTLDMSKWQHEVTMGGGGNNEFQIYHYQKENSYVKNGVLYIKPGLTSDLIGSEDKIRHGGKIDLGSRCTLSNWNGCVRRAGDGGNILNPVTSARLNTQHSFAFKYGRMEVRAKLPKGDWLWPAIWLLPRDWAYGGWPRSGEIDIMESRGNTYQGGVEEFGSTLHYGPRWDVDVWERTHGKKSLHGTDFNRDFHIFGLYWTKDRLYTYLDHDDNKVMDINIKEDYWSYGGFSHRTNLPNPWSGRPKDAPFDKEFFIILNVAVGGTNSYFPDGKGGKPWSDRRSHPMNHFYDAKNQWYPTWKGEQSAMQVDWVKVWKP